ncbi:ATP-binding cassette domain-containing protein [Oscillospiraceae bacterium PP1C4]
MENQYLLELYNVNRRISSEFYLRNITLTLKAGEVHALVGRNASGKSTLLSVIMGVFPLDSGEIRVGGKPVHIQDSKDAVQSGIMLVSQNQKMFHNLTVYENLFFGRELMVAKGVHMISNKKMIQASLEIFARMDVRIDPQERMDQLTAAQRQLVAIARAVISEAKIIMLDEPSTRLNRNEKQVLYDAINSLKAQGRTFLIISHDLDEVMAVADEVSVMENGELVKTAEISSFDKNSLIEATYGIKVEDLYHKEQIEAGAELLRAQGLTGKGFADVSLSLHHGQMVALMGDAQSGKVEIVRALAGIRKMTGTICVNGTQLASHSPIAAVQAGIALACTTEDEEEIKESEQLVNEGKQDTMLSRMRVGFNLFTAGLGKTFSPYVGMRSRGEYMTGGNRQRELVERTMRKQAELYILCEPSAGVDIPARMRIYYEINRLLKKGAGVLLLTTDPDEAFGLADRIVVVSDGRVVLDAPAKELTREQVLEYIRQ